MEQSLLPAFARFLMGVLLIITAPKTFAQEEPDKANVLDEALAEAGLTRASFQPDPLKLIASDPRGRTPILRALLTSPLSAGYRVGMLEKRFRDRTDSPNRMMLSAITLTGADIARGYLGNPLSEIDRRLLSSEDPLATSLKEIASLGEGFDWENNLPSINELPNPLRHEIARLLMAACSAERFRKRAFRKIGITPDIALETLKQTISSRFEDFDGHDYRIAIRDVEYEALFAGMMDLVLAMEDFEFALNQMEDFPEITWRQQTPLGAIIIHTLQENTAHEESNALLTVDLYGDDHYVFVDQSEPVRSGISLIFDREGNDRYVTTPGRGASGIFGYGIQWDVAGDDSYGGGEFAQASAAFGAALLLDRSGSDTYEALLGSQAFALAGAALLVDFDGDDQYQAITSSQASAEPYGAAVLFDVAGNDRYFMGGDRILSRSAQSPSNNNSMGQGCGIGVRSDLSDGRSLPGGAAMLIDASGDDTYTAEVFAQGTGFLEGAGMLVDGGGNDRYSAVWYSQASGAHSAAGVLIDRGEGNDSYETTKYTGISAAHDLSVSFLIDEGGDDQYSIANLGIGGANDNGTAIFADLSGDDSYTLKNDHGIGAAKLSYWGTSREASLGIGLFFDLGGVDSYDSKRKEPGNDQTFLSPRKYPELELKADLGVGMDREAESPFHTGPRTQSDGYAEKMLRDTERERREYRAKIAEISPNK